MSFQEQRRRRKHRQSVNWEMLVAMMTSGHELGLAEADGVEDSQQFDRALEVRDAVADVIGWENLIEVFISMFHNRQQTTPKVVSRPVYFLQIYPVRIVWKLHTRVISVDLHADLFGNPIKQGRSRL